MAIKVIGIAGSYRKGRTIDNAQAVVLGSPANSYNVTAKPLERVPSFLDIPWQFCHTCRLRLMIDN